MATHVLPFSRSATRARQACVGAAFLVDPTPHAHAVQFYDSEAFLLDTVGNFLGAGLEAGDSVVVVATPEHRAGFVARLQARGVEGAISQGRMLLLDARETLSRFIVGGMPDPDLFRDCMARLLSRLPDAWPRTRVRAYGEMVDLLWRDGNARAAIRMEELWNEAGRGHPVSTLCAYGMRNFYREGDGAQFMAVCQAHSHVIPSESFSALDDPDAQLRQISLLQQRARALESEIAHRKQLESALRAALRERTRAEAELRAYVKREQQARELAEASDAYKEMFVGILGHDLRNPLNTILTTARVMKGRRELPAETAKQLDRVVSSGVRMERMIDQLLDVTRARLADGIPVTPTHKHDLVPIVRRIAEELQVVHPERAIEVRSEGPCVARLDPDRFEQVISNLVGNALAHGDPARPVTVEVAARGAVASLSVHNFGAPIDPALMPVLFDPFKRLQRTRERANGLGLGLYIAERIVSAHGGRIAVESTADVGTRFEVMFPAG